MLVFEFFSTRPTIDVGCLWKVSLQWFLFFIEELEMSSTKLGHRLLYTLTHTHLCEHTYTVAV
jgi:hypothetical protein